MNPERLMTIPCTITHRAQDDVTVDGYGNPTVTETTTDTVCWFHQGAGQIASRYSTDQTGLAEVTAETWTVYLPPDTVIDATDEVATPDGVFEVDGPVWPARHPRTGAVEFVLGTAVKRG